MLRFANGWGWRITTSPGAVANCSRDLDRTAKAGSRSRNACEHAQEPRSGDYRAHYGRWVSGKPSGVLDRALNLRGEFRCHLLNAVRFCSVLRSLLHDFLVVGSARNEVASWHQIAAFQLLGHFILLLLAGLLSIAAPGNAMQGPGSKR